MEIYNTQSRQQIDASDIKSVREKGSVKERKEDRAARVPDDKAGDHIDLSPAPLTASVIGRYVHLIREEGDFPPRNGVVEQARARMQGGNYASTQILEAIAEKLLAV